MGRMNNDLKRKRMITIFLGRIKEIVDSSNKEWTNIKIARSLGVGRAAVSLWFSSAKAGNPSITDENIGRLERLFQISYQDGADVE